MHENNTKNKHPRAPHDLSLPATLFLKPIIHGRFEQISEKILMTDRLRREAVDYEKKLWRNYKP
ncbi:unnamed protein product, partial [Brassica oleracea var. botrytis]